MGVFVDYLRNRFVNIAPLVDTPQTILTADTNVLIVNSIIVCNYGEQDIRFNLKRVGSTMLRDTFDNFLTYNLEIKSYKTDQGDSRKLNTIDVIALVGMQIFLEIGDSLICYSNGYTQKFDCEVSYTKLNGL